MPPFHRPLQVIVMGVSGCGKSTVSHGIAQVLGLEWVDGDDLHLPSSVAKMRAGVALEDADRWPWLDRIGDYLVSGEAAGRVVACSALKHSYRDRIRRLATRVRFVFLDGSPELIRERLAKRTDHYMPPELLNSQFNTLERPQDDETDVITLPIERSVDQLVAKAIAALQCPDLAPSSTSSLTDSVSRSTFL